jgi:lipoprotein-releasing system permease protein
MNLPYEWHIGWRYTRAGRAGRRNGFISFISGVSMLGIALGVAALVIVLSVMNGFQKEVRDRMLSVIAHIEVMDAGGNALPDWRATAAAAQRDPRVTGAAPYIHAQGLVGRGEELRFSIVRGIDPAEEGKVTDLARTQGELLARLKPGEWNIVLGVELARMLGARIGDKVTVISPSGQTTPAGVVPRLKQFTLVGVFDVGHYEYDSALALIHLDDAARLFRVEGPTGVQLRLANVHDARLVGQDVAGEPGPQHAGARLDTHQPQLVRRGADREAADVHHPHADRGRGGLQPGVHAGDDGDRQAIRHCHPAHAGRQPAVDHGHLHRAGRHLGNHRHAGRAGAGLGVAFNIDVIVPAIERAFGVAFLPGSIYVISRMPSQPMAADIVPVAVISLLLSLAATLYPSWRASRVNPAEALRYE